MKTAKNHVKPPCRTDYVHARMGDFHQKRSRYILKKYPQVKAFMKPYPWSIVYIVLLMAFQIALGTWLVAFPWWVSLIVAASIGAFASHALFVLLHDSSHNLIFSNEVLSKLTCILVNAGQGMPSGVSFKEFHLKHHAHFTDYRQDCDIPLVQEGKIVKNSTIMKMLWLFNLGFVQSLRPTIKGMKVLNSWSLANLIFIIITNTLIVYFAGWHTLIYLLLSTVFGLGACPLGARWIQEHFIFRSDQPTYSYYGIGNNFTFNIGYHTEHHDLMNIPWVNLPKLKNIAPECYDSLLAHTSWSLLYLKFIFDKKISLFDRIVETDKR